MQVSVSDKGRERVMDYLCVRHDHDRSPEVAELIGYALGKDRPDVVFVLRVRDDVCEK
jgi:hypothetical protein